MRLVIVATILSHVGGGDLSREIQQNLISRILEQLEAVWWFTIKMYIEFTYFRGGTKKFALPLIEYSLESFEIVKNHAKSLEWLDGH